MQLSNVTAKQVNDLNLTEKVKANEPVSSTASDGSSSDEHQSDADMQLSTPSEEPVKTLMQMIEPRFWSVVVLASLAAFAPMLITGTVAVTALYRLFGARAEKVPWNGKTAIVTGGKVRSSLDIPPMPHVPSSHPPRLSRPCAQMTKSFVIIKQLKAQGCRVVLCETKKYWMVASRFSNCIDRFVTVPVPEKDTEGFLSAMVNLAEEEKADVFVPVTSPVASQYEARLNSVLPKRVQSWSLTYEDCEDLDDKVAFCNSAAEMGLSVPRTHRVVNNAEVRAFNEKLQAQLDAAPAGTKQPRFILKNLQYDSMHRLDLFTLPCAPAKLDAYLADITIDEANPWTVQTFIVGDEFSTCAVVKEGRLLTFSDNAASISCFNYLPERNPRLREWVTTFCAERRVSGIVCIDFIVDKDDGTPYAIECNPRFSSNIASFYNNPAFGAVLCAPDAFSSAVEPLPSAVETYWLFSEIWAAVAGKGEASYPARALTLLHTLLHKKDAYFDASDPLPFLAHFCVHLPTLLVRNLYNGNKWAKIDPCIGKMTEENGD